jgi:hypothetical protein
MNLLKVPFVCRKRYKFRLRAHMRPLRLRESLQNIPWEDTFAFPSRVMR